MNIFENARLHFKPKFFYTNEYLLLFIDNTNEYVLLFIDNTNEFRPDQKNN